MPRVLTGSSLDRAAECPASAVLPQRPDEPNVYALAGTALHNQLENRDPALDLRLRDHGTSLDELWPDGGVHEAIVWYDPLRQVAGWEPKLGGHRDYSAYEPHVLVGTIDYLNPDLGMVDDLKSGRIPPSPTSLQVGLAALGVSELRHFPVTGSITHLPRGGGPDREVLVHDADVAGFVKSRLDYLYADHLLNKARVDLGAEPEYNPSPARCKYCRAICVKRA